MDPIDSVMPFEYSISKVRLGEYSDLPFLWLECVSGSGGLARGTSSVREALTGATAVMAHRSAAGKIIGFVILKEDVVVMLGVRPAFCGQGVATGLLWYVVRAYGAVGVDSRFCDARTSTLYQRCGLRVVPPEIRACRSQLPSTQGAVKTRHISKRVDKAANR